MTDHEKQGTAYDPHASGHELQGREPAPATQNSTERLSDLLATLHHANPADTAAWHIKPGHHAAFSKASITSSTASGASSQRPCSRQRSGSCRGRGGRLASASGRSGKIAMFRCHHE